MFYYSDNQPRGDFQGDVWKMNGTTAYLNHYDNLMYLKFMATHGTLQEKRQAEKEIVICERKLTFWERHPNADSEQIRIGVERKIKDWKGRV